MFERLCQSPCPRSAFPALVVGPDGVISGPFGVVERVFGPFSCFGAALVLGALWTLASMKLLSRLIPLGLFLILPPSPIAP